MLSLGSTAQANRDIGHFIDGSFVREGLEFDDVCPSNGQPIGSVREASADMVDRAVEAARKALRGPWGRTTAPERAHLLRKIADEISRRADDFVPAEILDTGKPISLAAHLDIPRAAANFRFFADQIMVVPNESFQSDTEDGRGALNYAIRKPRGVIAVVCPWNLPLLLMTWKVAPALACGNAVVVKPSEETPATAELLGEVMNAVGVPAGVYNVVQGFGTGSAGAFLTQHPHVGGITFTGETSTGAAIMKAASDGIRPVSLELGGKNAAIIFADCDLDQAVAGVMRSAFAHCGQVCLGTERVYVERSIFNRFLDKFVASAKTLTVGDPFDAGSSFGPLISNTHREKVLSFYAKAREDGATTVFGGGIPELPDALAGGFHIEPTIWTGLDPTSDVVTQEIFGPCCHVAPFDDEDAVIAWTNDTAYGLAASVWTGNVARAHRVSAQIDVGLVWVNSWFLRDLRTPFGGAKQSGIGREGGIHSLEFYTETSNICIKL